MNEVPQQPTAQAGLEQEHGICDYLAAHPDFFQRHEHLLTHLRLPHPQTGQAISLMERQIGLLREQKQELAHKLQHLAGVARTNEQLLERLQGLILRLIDSPSLEGALATLEMAMRQDFHADAVTVWLFADGDRPEFVDRDAPHLKAFRRSVEQGQPVCGYLRPEQIEILFSNGEQPVASGAIIPLCEGPGSDCLGLVGLGSADPKRFHPEMGTVFLRHLGAVAARVIKSRLNP